MTRLLLAIITLLALPAEAAVPPQMKVEMIASTLAPKPGSTVLVGFRMNPQAGWHGYWSNAGGSGIAPTVTWSAPPGVTFGPLLHPAPSLFKAMGLVSYVHAGDHLLVSRMEFPSTVQPGTRIPVEAKLNWAVCSDSLCVPGNATFSLEMAAGSGAQTSEAATLKRALARVPRSLAGGSYWVEGKKLTLALPEELKLEPSQARFFPDENGFFDPSQAQTSRATPMRLTGPLSGNPPERITGVVTDGHTGYRISLPRETAMPPIGMASSEAPSTRLPAVAAASAEPNVRSRRTDEESAGPAAPPSRSALPVIVAGAIAIGGLLLFIAFGRRRRS